MSSSRADNGSKGVQLVVGKIRVGCAGDTYGGLGGGTDGGGRGDGQDGGGDMLSRWEYNVANVTLGTDPNDPLSYAPGLEHHYPIMSTLGETRVQLER